MFSVKRLQKFVRKCALLPFLLLLGEFAENYYPCLIEMPFLQKVFDGFSFWFFVWLYWISLSKSTMKEKGSFYKTKRNMGQRITSLQSSSILLWSFLIQSCNWINQTRKTPLDIFSLFLQIWAAYKPINHIRPFIREKK